MFPKIWFRPIMNITIALFCILFTILTVNTELEHYPSIISVKLLYWSYLVLKKKIYIIMKKKKFHNKYVRSKNTQLNHMRRSSIWTLSHFELNRKALRISYLSFTASWLNQQFNNNNTEKKHVLKSVITGPVRATSSRKSIIKTKRNIFSGISHVEKINSFRDFVLFENPI